MTDLLEDLVGEEVALGVEEMKDGENIINLIILVAGTLKGGYFKVDKKCIFHITYFICF